MTDLSRRATLAAAAIGIGIVSWMGAARVLKAAPQAASATKPMMSDQAFKNVQVLKGIPADDFLGTMGIMCASLGYDCSDCHLGAGTDTVDWASDAPVDGRPRKAVARRMVTMVETINRTNFSGRQMVTCWTCHRNRDRPVTTPPIEAIYTMPPPQNDDVIPTTPGLPPPSTIIDKYIQAVGGAQRLAGLKSFVGEGKSVSFGGFGGDAQVHLYSKAPDQRTLVLDYKDAPGRGDTTRSYDGKVGWLRTPLNVLGEYELSGGELDGARLDALLAFPSQINTALTALKTGLDTSISDLPGPSSQTDTASSVMVGQNHLVKVVQGTGPRGLLTTLYFDPQSGYLLRMVRFGKSPIGRVPTQIDFADYRDVGGIKFPFRMNFAWLDGRDAIQLSDIKVNVPIDAVRFGRPPALKK